MSEENVEVVRSMYGAFHGGDAERALSHFHPNVAFDTTNRVDGGIGQGREALNETVSSWLGAWEGWREEIEEMRDLGSQVLVLATQRGRGKGSGVEIENRYALLYEVEDGRITRMTLHNSAKEALEAAGLQE